MHCLRGTQPTWFGREAPPEAGRNSYTFGGLPTLVTDGIRRGETWYFRLWIEPVPKGTAGLGQVFGGFRQDTTGIEEYLVQGYPCIVINVSRLFGPLLDGSEESTRK